MKKSGVSNIVYDPRVVKEDLSGLDNLTRRRIEAAIANKLIAYPEIYGEPLRSKLHRYWKLRVGHWRIIYEISGKIVIIRIIGHRSKVYRLMEKRV